MKALKHFECLLHFAAVEFVFNPPDIALTEGRAPAGNKIQVAAADGVMAGMEKRRCVFHFQNIDAGRKVIVDAHAQRFRMNFFGRFQMGDLFQRVHAGVGSSRALDFDRRAQKLFSRGDQGILNAAGVFLRLPAAVVGAVVLQC